MLTVFAIFLRILRNGIVDDIIDSCVQGESMIRTPRYTFADILQAPAIALSAKRIGLMAMAVVCSWAVYALFAYSSFLIAGDNLESILRTWGMFPFAIPNGLAAQSVWGIGVLGATICMMTGFAGVAGFCMEEARGNRFMSFGQGLSFALKRLKQIVLALTAIVSFVAFVMLLFVFAGVIGRIPFVGESMYALIMLFPGFLIALFLVFILAVGAVGVVLLPTVTAADRRNEAFMSILETFSTLIRQPLCWLGASAITALFAKVATWLFLAASLAAVRLLIWAGGVLGGDGIGNMYRSALAKMSVNSEGGEFLMTIWPGVRTGHLGSLIPRASSGSDFGGYVLASVLGIILAIAVSYGLCIIIAGQARAYILIKFLKDGHRISDEPSIFGDSASSNQ
jgi:hypothetical protein